MPEIPKVPKKPKTLGEKARDELRRRGLSEKEIEFMRAQNRKTNPPERLN